MAKAKEVAVDLLSEDKAIWLWLYSFLPESLRDYFDITVYKKSSLEFIKQLVKEADKRHQKGETGADFMSQMLAHQIDDKDKFNENVRKGFTKDEVLATSVIATLAGFETTRSVIEFVIYLLAGHPQVQEKLYTEITRLNPS